MNNKMALNTYLSTTECKKQTKQASKNRDRIMDMEIILKVARSEGVWGNG